MLYIKKTLIASLEVIETPFQEAIFCKIKLGNKDTILIGCIYRSPSIKLNNLIELFKSITVKMYSNLLLMGDFNLREINWKDCSTSVGEEHIATKFLEYVWDKYLFQHVKEFTKILKKYESPILDLILTNEEHMISEMELTAGPLLRIYSITNTKHLITYT